MELAAVQSAHLDVPYDRVWLNWYRDITTAPWAVQAMGVDNVSHGCVSLSPAAAEWHCNTANIGDPVIVQE